MSGPTRLNQALPLHLDTLQIVSGGPFRIFGRNLKLAGFTPVVTVDNGCGLGPVPLDRTIRIAEGEKADPFDVGVGWTSNYGQLLEHSYTARVAADDEKDNSEAIQNAVNEVSKAGKKYEFGNKVSLAVTSKGSWIVGTMSLEGNPYDGHTLSTQLNQARDLLGGGRVQEVFVERGYRGHKHEGEEAVYVDRERRGLIPKTPWRFMKRRAAIEPTIGHLKCEHRLERNRR